MTVENWMKSLGKCIVRAENGGAERLAKRWRLKLEACKRYLAQNLSPAQVEDELNRLEAKWYEEQDEQGFAPDELECAFEALCMIKGELQ